MRNVDYQERDWSTAMIIEVRAVAPFYKNGFVVACERTREGHAHRSRRRSGRAARRRPGPGSRRPARAADARARRPRHRRCRRERSARCAGLSASRRSVSLRARRRAGSDVRLQGAPAAAGRSSSTTRTPIRFGRLRSARAPHPRPLSGRRLPADRRNRARQASICSSATRCLPARSAGRICRAATTRR